MSRRRGAMGWGPIGVILMLPVISGGCERPLFPDDGVVRRVDPSGLRRIDEVEMRGLTRTPPVSVEEGTRTAMARLEQRGEPVVEVTTEISLAEVRAAALANNLDLRVELYNPSLAQSRVNEEEAKFEWTFFGNFSYSDFERPTGTTLEANTGDVGSLDLGVRVPLRTGGEVTVDFPATRTNNNNAFNTINPAFDGEVRFSISQPLLRNAGFRVNTASIRVAKYQSQIADARTKLEAIRILANADRAYWLLYAAKRELEVQQERFELAVDQLERAQRLVAAGSAAEVEVIRAQSGVADSLSSIITASTALRIRQRDLKRIMNIPELPMDSPDMLVPATLPAPVGLELNSGELATRAVQNRMEMLELELQLAIDASDIDFARNQALPLFVLDFNYGFVGLGSNFTQSINQIGRGEFDQWTVGLRAEVPIGNEAAKSRIHQSILTRVQRLATRDLRRQSIRQEVFDSLDRLREQWQRILAARQQVILNGRTYEAEKRQFELGLRTSTDVLDAAARLSDAQTREVAALADYQIAQVDIAFATGTLLGNGRVIWNPLNAGQEVMDPFWKRQRTEPRLQPSNGPVASGGS